MAAVHDKLAKLRTILREMNKVAVAFSGGVDSTFLLAVAHETLGDNAMGITVKAAMISDREFAEAREIVEQIGAKHLILNVDEMEIDGFRQNTDRRCYYCKTAIFTNIRCFAAQHGIQAIVDGSNIDDLGDYRPGLQALEELNVRSPLREAGMSKQDIRDLSKHYGLETWDKPAFACLASRIPYGTEITKALLARVEQAEDVMHREGFRQYRVRAHGDLARIEVAPDERPKLFDLATLDRVSEAIKAAGFKYVAMELEGYRMGALNVSVRGDNQ